MEEHPEQFSYSFRLNMAKRIHAEYSKAGHNAYELAIGLLDLRPASAVLDIGCGLGEFLVNLRARGHFGKLVGIDNNHEMIKAAKDRARNIGADVDFKLMDATTEAFRPGTFDRVTAIHVIGSACPDKCLRQIGRILRVSGVCVVSANSRSCFPLLEKIREKARERFGWISEPVTEKEFRSENAKEILMNYFGSVEEFRYEDAIQYPDAEVLVNFFKAYPGLVCDGLSVEQWDRIIDWARDEALDLIPEHSYAEDPNTFSLFRCTNPLGL
ncbi:MAG TPA: class I SAM-dependent methyltransferase [bacterium]|jgi:SAM-dependent methyltransferase